MKIAVIVIVFSAIWVNPIAAYFLSRSLDKKNRLRKSILKHGFIYLALIGTLEDVLEL